MSEFGKTLLSFPTQVNQNATNPLHLKDEAPLLPGNQTTLHIMISSSILTYNHAQDNTCMKSLGENAHQLISMITGTEFIGNRNVAT